MLSRVFYFAIFNVGERSIALSHMCFRCPKRSTGFFYRLVRRQMKPHLGIVTLSAIAGAPMARGAESLCTSLREFVNSVKPGEMRAFTFHTSWGADFNDSSEPALFAKGCSHGGYLPAQKVCD